MLNDVVNLWFLGNQETDCWCLLGFPDHQQSYTLKGKISSRRNFHDLVKCSRFRKDLFSQMTQYEKFCDELFSRIEKKEKFAWFYFYESAKM